MKKTKTTVIGVGLLLLAGTASANTPASLKLRCWDIFAQRGARPAVVADILSNSTIANAVFTFEGRAPAQGLSASGTSAIDAQVYTRRPYGTVNQYLVRPAHQDPELSFGPLILPLNLSPAGLASAIIPSQNPSIRRNGVLMGWSHGGDGGRNWSMHLHCISSASSNVR